MAKTIFVTATGTDTGKTYISALIVKIMNEQGLNCGYFKPVMSGADGSGMNDCEYVINTSNLGIIPEECYSYSFKEPLSPHLASERAGIKIEQENILKDYNILSEKYDYLLVEGAGGIVCPIIKSEYFMWNLIKDLGTDTVLIADAGLGTINSVVTSCDYLKNKNINLRGIILNNYEPDNFMHNDNIRMIETITNNKVDATVERNADKINADFETVKALFL